MPDGSMCTVVLWPLWLRKFAGRRAMTGSPVRSDFDAYSTRLFPGNHDDVYFMVKRIPCRDGGFGLDGIR